MNKLPPLNALRYFLTAAKTMSFKEAADQMYVTQAAISQHIKTLEAFLGCQLFERGHRRISLTRAGQALLPDITTGFDYLNKGVRNVALDSRPNILNLTVIESLSSRWLVPRLYRFQQRYPHINVRIQPTNRLLNFAQDELDLAIRFGQGEYKQLESRQLASDTMHLVCHPRLASKILTPGSLSTYPILKENSSDVMPAWDQFYAQHTILPNNEQSALQVDDSSITIIEAALAGQGVAMIRHSLIYEQLERGQLVKLFDFSFDCHYAYYLVAPPAHFTREKVQQFSSWLEEMFDEIPKVG
ncbi:LysR substrate-binding domain-containing protein [Paraglaciecola sp. 20A4]|uniref:LysR substrate-binding domain-containing protein n=1 Tax=Paraglaciecola sp. 20A4 TaxID=2687288 RepID=UPI00140A1F20|nr:LysR substrate-binding domain-containing protein [Paraglaciecola sp. 20A4]